LLFVWAVVSLALAGLIPAALDRFMDKMRYASWSGMPVVAVALYKALRSEYGYF
jgi:hypothetical protein